MKRLEHRLSSSSIRDDDSVMENSRQESPRMIVFFSLFGWIVTGYAFFTLIIFSNSIGNAFFHSDNESDMHYVMFGIIALTLLARFGGGLVFGRLSDIRGRLYVIKIVLISITVLTFVSLFFPFYDKNVEFVPILFIISRILIGFFTGGLWPTGGVYALEQLQDFYRKSKNYTPRNNWFFPHSSCSTKIKTLGWQSAWIQSGFQWAILLEETVKLGLIQFSSSVPSLPGNPLISDASFASHWVIVSGLGVAIGLVGIWLSFRMNESRVWERKVKDYYKLWPKKILTSHPSFDFRTDAKDPKLHKKIVNLWLIMAGVMYLFYSTMAIITGYFPRSDYIVDICPSNGGAYCNWVFGALMFVIISLAAHILPGQHLTKLWNETTRGSKAWDSFDPDVKNRGFFRRAKNFWQIFWNPSFFYRYLIRLDIRFFRGIRLITRDSNRDDHENNHINEIDKKFMEKCYKNKDLLIILTHAYLVLWPSLALLAFFFFIFLSLGNTDIPFHIGEIDNTIIREGLGLFIYASAFFLIAYILFIVTSTWSIIPSILSSMFPVERRNFWTSAIYTGGVVVGFAAPFVSIQIIQQYDHVWLLLPLIFGAISIVVGARSLIMENPFRPGDF